MRFVKKYRADRRRLRLQGEEVSQVEYSGYGSIPRSKVVSGSSEAVARSVSHSSVRGTEDPFGERSLVAHEQLLDQPRWFI
jgi:hypothetical protein